MINFMGLLNRVWFYILMPLLHYLILRIFFFFQRQNLTYKGIKEFHAEYEYVEL